LHLVHEEIGFALVKVLVADDVIKLLLVVEVVL